MIKKLELKQFRNHLTKTIEFNKNLVYLVGPNGSGKTSILESIYFASTTKSHRTNNEKEMIQENQPFSIIKLKTVTNDFQIVLSDTGKRAFINQVEKRKISDYIGHFKVVMFSPEDLSLIKGSPSDRRKFMDLELMQLYPSYLQTLSQYKKVLKQRNLLLKKIKIDDDYTFLNILGEQLLELGEVLISKRKAFLEELQEELNKAYKLFSNYQTTIQYIPYLTKEKMIEHFTKKQKYDIINQTTMAGPHKDDFIILFNEKIANAFASQGEQRLIMIALKLALLKLIQKHENKEIVLLLDDVLSELDDQIQKTILEQLPKNQQIIISSAVKILENNNIQMIQLNKGA
ncbi:DNA replication and repair protein RecF [Alteracholeplasma palmae J233]|uniref:DNA replication and repair protein RecF n=1 Tax=Alteracholeplasma palmae (strain ATCC 49389 / J233) TaxID=1318466 RepID=U4KJL0_ALTPJ|nr:DNA replication/repair protein RecF [Alteracholeplasma palmae]CCV63582.1 DNA replication and repair protein RecF [Alteracholeplasma palmae J233]